MTQSTKPTGNEIGGRKTKTNFDFQINFLRRRHHHALKKKKSCEHNISSIGHANGVLQHHLYSNFQHRKFKQYSLNERSWLTATAEIICSVCYNLERNS